MNPFIKLLPVLSFCCFVINAQAQNVSSPYSIIGIGDIETSDCSRFSASGSASTARRESGFYNFSNPASLSAMPFKSINLDFAFRGRITTFQEPGKDTTTATTKDFILKRITLAGKIGKRTGYAIGLKPYSSINYQYESKGSISDGNAVYTKYNSGTGGIYQVYVAGGHELTRRLSVGATLSWLFGSVDRNINYYNSDYELNITKDETTFYYGAALQLGLQYYSLPENKWQQVFGFTTTVNTNLHGQLTTTYADNDSAISTKVTNTTAFKMPIGFTVGYSIRNKKGLMFNADVYYNKWVNQQLGYLDAITADNIGIHAGIEYSKKIKLNNNNIVEDHYLGIGGKIEQAYIQFNNTSLMNYALTFGGGKNISRFISANASLEIGKRGKSSLQQIRENYTQVNIGLTLKDFWFGNKAFGRYK